MSDVTHLLWHWEITASLAYSAAFRIRRCELPFPLIILVLDFIFSIPYICTTFIYITFFWYLEHSRNCVSNQRDGKFGK
jgi:hypothetical protein